MRLETLTTPAPVVTFAEAAAFLQLYGEGDRPLVEQLLAAATEHAETEMEATLAPRTYRATFDAGELAELPRGPVVELLDVSAGGVDHTAGARLESSGTLDVVRLPVWHTGPVVVTYRAGHEPPATVPADVRQMILIHAAAAYRDRESGEAPKGAAAFYRRRRRGTGNG